MTMVVRRKGPGVVVHVFNANYTGSENGRIMI
jgi:hypothetical protein